MFECPVIPVVPQKCLRFNDIENGGNTGGTTPQFDGRANSMPILKEGTEGQMLELDVAVVDVWDTPTEITS